MDDFDPSEEERRNVRNLLRWVAAFLAWPGLSISLVFLLDLEGHVGHFFLTLVAGLSGVALFFAAPRLADRFVP